MCILCSVAGVALARLDINIFTQIGFVVLVGLASKNAILIVEFAKSKREAGMPRFEATLAACRLRLRPIMMTSFAFILGVVPLVISSGAGAEMRRTLGVAVFSGMLGALFGIFHARVLLRDPMANDRRPPPWRRRAIPNGDSREIPMSRPARSQELLTAMMKEAIYEAAVAVLAEHGAAGMTMERGRCRNLAEEACTATSTANRICCNSSTAR